MRWWVARGPPARLAASDTPKAVAGAACPARPHRPAGRRPARRLFTPSRQSGKELPLNREPRPRPRWFPPQPGRETPWNPQKLIHNRQKLISCRQKLSKHRQKLISERQALVEKREKNASGIRKKPVTKP
jgi:hypothetical protein